MFSFVGIRNVKYRIINTEDYSVDFGVLDLLLGVIFLVPNIHTHTWGERGRDKKNNLQITIFNGLNLNE